jgi:hypothetical protein
MLLTLDYEVAMLLTLDVNDTGGLSPSFNFPYPNFAFNVGANLSQSREDTFNVALTYSMRELFRSWQKDKDLGLCPETDTNLAGNLGLRRIVEAALDTPDMIKTTDVSPTAGEFSGIVNFTLTRNINSAGPTWTLTNFVEPGNLASLSRVNNDKLSFGFATGKHAGTPFDTRIAYRPDFAKANRALERVILNNLGTQLNAIRNLTK